VIEIDTPVDVCVNAALLSMDSPLRSPRSVGMPLDLTVIVRDELRFLHERRIEEQDPASLTLSEARAGALRNAFRDMGQFSVM